MSFYKKLIFFLPWVSVILWMMLIYHFSTQPAVHSNKISKGATEFAVKTVKRVSPETDLSIDRLNQILRKNAHFFIYFMLAIWVFHALNKSGIRGIKGFFLAMAICVLFAITDEFYQSFVPGRGPRVKDVFIDSGGALVGIGLYRISSNVVKKLIMSSGPPSAKG